jgi:hypothetical protein
MDHGRIQDLDTPFGLVHRLDTAYRIPFHTPRARFPRTGRGALPTSAMSSPGAMAPTATSSA